MCFIPKYAVYSIEGGCASVEGVGGRVADWRGCFKQGWKSTVDGDECVGENGGVLTTINLVISVEMNCHIGSAGVCMWRRKSTEFFFAVSSLIS